MREWCSFRWLSSLRAPSLDKISALSLAIAYQAKGHLRNDRADMTDISCSRLSTFSPLCRKLTATHYQLISNQWERCVRYFM